MCFADEHTDQINLDGLIDSPGTSDCRESVLPSFGLISPSHIPDQIKSMLNYIFKANLLACSHILLTAT